MNNDNNIKINDVFGSINNLSVAELVKLIDVINKEWNLGSISLNAGSTSSTNNDSEEKEEKKEEANSFNIKLISFEENKKLDAIRFIKAKLGSGTSLRVAREKAEQLPSLLLEGIDKDKAKALQEEAKKLGLELELQGV